jgi:RimJ/RimL family protein N-acetyltransferase
MEAGTDLHWCIADRTSDAMLGNVQIFRMGPVQDRCQGELGYWLRPGARQRGIIGEALRPVIAHAFTPAENGGLGLIRLHACTDSDNYASQSILRSAGFTQWGADHQACRRTDGSLSDGVHFELLASELPTSGLPASWPLAGTDCPATAPLAVEPVTLESNGIRLRKWRHTDAERVVETCSDERAQHWLAHSLPSPYTLEHAHSFIAGLSEDANRGKTLSWCVADAESDVCVGSVAIMDLRHAFIPREDGGLGRQRLQLIAADGNSASEHIARVNGFVEVGRDRQAERLDDGTFTDLVRFDLLVDEWNAGG